MKRVLSVCLISAILFSLCEFTVNAAGMVISVGTMSSQAGTSVSVPITLYGNTGFSNLGIEIEYDNTYMTLTNVTCGQTGATFTVAQSIAENPYNMSWDSTSNNTFNGTIATLDFEITENAEQGDYPIMVSYYKGRNGDYTDGEDVNYDEDFASLNISYVSGCVSISGENIAENSISVSDIQNNPVSFKAKLQSTENISGIAIAAIYDYDGKLIAVRQYNAASQVDFSFENIENVAKVKVFWWDSIGGMIPQAKSKTVDL
jgi:hypothetical protein